MKKQTAGIPKAALLACSKLSPYAAEQCLLWPWRCSLSMAVVKVTVTAGTLIDSLPPLVWAVHYNFRSLSCSRIFQGTLLAFPLVDTLGLEVSGFCLESPLQRSPQAGFLFLRVRDSS